MESLPLFVYGTLRRGRANYGPYLAGQTLREEPALLRGAALYTCQRIYPALVEHPALVRPGEAVRGELMTIRPAGYAATLTAIDRLEDYRPGRMDSWYLRVVRMVETTRGLVPAWTYLAGPQSLAAALQGRAGRFRNR